MFRSAGASPRGRVNYFSAKAVTYPAWETGEGVWAVGNCAGSPHFTHIAFDAESDRILGFTAFGPEAGEIIALVQVAKHATLKNLSRKNVSHGLPLRSL